MNRDFVTNMRIRVKLLLGFVVVLAITTMVSAFGYLTQTRRSVTIAWVGHTNEVMLEIDRVLMNLIDMETGFRGYMATGDETFLEPYNTGAQQIDANLRALQDLTADNPQQLAYWDDLATEYENWITEWVEPGLALRAQANQAQVSQSYLDALIVEGKGKVAMDGIRSDVAELETNLRAENDLEGMLLAKAMLQAMIDQETGMRGFIITGDENFLEPYRQGQLDLAAHSSALRLRVAGEAANVALIDQIEAFALQWRDERAEAWIAARRQINENPTTVADVVAYLETGGGKQMMDAMRGTLADAMQEEADLLVQRQREDATAATLANGVTIFGSLGALVLGLIIALFLSGNIAKSINHITSIADAMASGDLSQTITVQRGDEIGQLAEAFRKMKANLVAMMTQVGVLTEAAVAGKLDFRADVTEFTGDYRDIVQGVNDTLDAVIGPLSVAAEYVARISKGDIPAPIADEYQGDFNEIKFNLNLCIAALSGLLAEVNHLTQSAVEGRLDVRGNEGEFSGGYADLVRGINVTIDSLVGHLNDIPVPSMIVDKQFNIRFASRSAAELFGVAQDALIGRKCHEYLKTGDCGTGRCACARAMHGGQREMGETDMHPQGRDLQVTYYGVPIRNQQGEIIGALETLVDQTEVKQALNEAEVKSLQVQSMADDIQAANERLEEMVQDYVAYATLVGQGDLTRQLTLDGKGNKGDDPLIVLGHNLNEMTASLREMLSRIQQASGDLSAASAEILAATTQQASGASEQSAAITQTTTTVDEVRTVSEQAIVRAQEVADSAQRTVAVSRSGRQAVDETLESMAVIRQRVAGIAENILALSEQTQQIGEITTTVSDIASQSNMLALNASVEAARAGEQGKGFAVVAVEVRNLANQSKQATAQVRAILTEIQDAINKSVMVTEEGTKAVDEGVRLAQQAREAIEQLASAIAESAQIASQVVAGGQQQASGVEQIALAMQNITQAMQQSMASTRQAEKAAQDLTDLAQQLTQMVDEYQL